MTKMQFRGVLPQFFRGQASRKSRAKRRRRKATTRRTWRPSAWSYRARRRSVWQCRKKLQRRRPAPLDCPSRYFPPPALTLIDIPAFQSLPIKENLGTCNLVMIGSGRQKGEEKHPGQGRQLVHDSLTLCRIGRPVESRLHQNRNALFN